MIKLTDDEFKKTLVFIIAEFERNANDTCMGFGLLNNAYDKAFYKLSGLSNLFVGKREQHNLIRLYISDLDAKRLDFQNQFKGSGAARSPVASPVVLGREGKRALDKYLDSRLPLQAG